MRWRALFLISLVVNVVLAAAWFSRGRQQNTTEIFSSGTNTPLIKTNVLVRRQFFSWSQVESPDYKTYIENLRGIDCPEQTIRDIIIADVNAMYARRLATELTTPEQQWWRSEPDTNVVRLAAQKSRQIEGERRALLTSLLGPNWETGDLLNLPRPSRPGVALDGPLLGSLPMETKQAVEEISMRSQERLQAFLSTLGQRDRATEAAELAKLREQTRLELAGVLSPPQLEEYLLRYSQNASNLRSELGNLKHFNATPDEFRAIFRATDNLDQRIQQLAGSIDPNSVLQRNNLLQERENAIRTALGAERYSLYTSLRDPIYREAYAQAQQAGTPQAADVIYQINLATAQEQAAIRGNTNLTEAQRAIALKELELRQLTANAMARGEEVPDLPEDRAPVPPAPPDPSAGRNVRTHSYVFAVGDTVASVAQRYGVSMTELRAANPDLNFRNIRPGETIRIPDRALK